MAECIQHAELEDYYVDEHLGAVHGAFGKVKVMSDRKSGEKVAVKLLQRSKVTEQVEREIRHYHMLRHPCVVQLRRVLLTQFYLALVLDYVPGGSLMRFVDRKILSEPQVRFLFQQLVAALEFCHRQGALPRSLSLDTILVGGQSYPELKLTDFGFTAIVDSLQDEQGPGITVYAAPEVLIRSQSPTAFRPFNLKAAAQTADLWSLGVILAALLFHAYPFADPVEPKNVDRTFKRIINAEYTIPEGISLSEACKDLLSKLFKVKPEERATIADIRKHEWFCTRIPKQLNVPYEALPPAEGSQSIEDIVEILDIVRHKKFLS